MKKRKIKLLASLTSLVLVVAVMAVGVWAASSATVNITGNVSYNAKGNVSATVSVTEIDGSSQSDKSVTIAPTETSSEAKEISLGEGLTVKQVEGSTASATWSYTFTIKNNYAEAAEKTTLYAKVTLPSAGTNYSISATVAIPSVESGAAQPYTTDTEITLAENVTATFVITLTVTDVTASISSANVGSSIALSVTPSN